MYAIHDSIFFTYYFQAKASSETAVKPIKIVHTAYSFFANFRPETDENHFKISTVPKYQTNYCKYKCVFYYKRFLFIHNKQVFLDYD